MLANTCLYSCSASGSISLHPLSYGKEENILREGFGSQPSPVKLSGSHMALAVDKEKTCTFLELLDTVGWQLWRWLILTDRDGTLGEGSSNCWCFLNVVKKNAVEMENVFTQSLPAYFFVFNFTIEQSSGFCLCELTSFTIDCEV